MVPKQQGKRVLRKVVRSVAFSMPSLSPEMLHLPVVIKTQTKKLRVLEDADGVTRKAGVIARNLKKEPPLLVKKGGRYYLIFKDKGLREEVYRRLAFKK
jgi:hypothetical protein